MVNFNEIIGRIKSFLGISLNKELAVIMGLSASDFSKRKKTGAILPLIIDWGIAQKVDLNWLIKGYGSQPNKSLTYNIDTIESEVHSPDVVYCPDPWHETLKKAKLILEANTEDSNALAANIKAAHKSMLEKADLKKRVEQLEKLSTIGREKEENNLTRKTGS